MGLQKTIKSWAAKTVGKMYGGFGEDSFFARWILPGKMSQRQFLESYQGYVYACVKSISESVAKGDLYVAKNDLLKGELRDDQHEVNRLLNRPNPDMSKFQFLEVLETHIEMAGEAFIYLAMGKTTKKPREMYLLRPDLMHVAFDKVTGLVTGYILRKTDGSETTFEKNEIVHIKMPHPINPYRGMGTVEAALMYIQTEDYAAKYSRNYLYNNATPAGVVSFPGTTDKEEFNKAKAQWKDNFGTVDNAGKLAFVRGDVKFTQIGSGLSEIALRELKGMTRDDIMTMFRVSKPMLGIVDDVNLANGKNAKRIFLENVIEPKLMRIVDGLNHALMPRYGEATNGEPLYVIRYENPVPEDELEVATVLQQSVDIFMTVNEARAMRNLPPIENGDQLRRPIGLIEVGAPIKQQKTVKQLTATITRTSKKKSQPKRKQLDFSVEQKENFRKSLFVNVGKWEKKYKKAVRDSMDRLNKQIASRLKGHKTKIFDDFLPSDNDIADIMYDETQGISVALFTEQGQAALAFAGSAETFQVNDRVKRTIRARVDLFASHFGEDLRAKLTDVVTTAIAEGETIDQIKGRIEDVFKTVKGSQAERIARTETSRYSNAAATEAYKQTGYVEAKEWFTNPGACEFCSSLNGKIVSLDNKFAEIGDTLTGTEGGQLQVDFEDVGEPPAHPNCECTVLPVVLK